MNLAIGGLSVRQAPYASVSFWSDRQVYVDRVDYELCEMDTDSLYLVLSTKTLEVNLIRAIDSQQITVPCFKNCGVLFNFILLTKMEKKWTCSPCNKILSRAHYARKWVTRQRFEWPKMLIYYFIFIFSNIGYQQLLAIGKTGTISNFGYRKKTGTISNFGYREKRGLSATLAIGKKRGLSATLAIGKTGIISNFGYRKNGDLFSKIQFSFYKRSA